MAAERRASDLGAAIRDNLVDIHVELGAAARHPDMQGKHVAVPTSQDLVAHLDDQSTALIIQALVDMIGEGSSFFQRCVRRDHLAWDQILADAEMLKRALRLRAPQLVCGNLNHAETIRLSSHVRHRLSPELEDERLEVKR
jgi:hypothetical protein